MNSSIRLLRDFSRSCTGRGLFRLHRGRYTNRAFDVECISTLADAQKSTATTGIERLVAFVGNLAAAKPEALDNVDFDEAVREYADLIGVTQKLIVAQQLRDKMRAQRNQQAAQQMAMQNSMAAAQGAKTLSDTEVGGGQNALQKMLGYAQPGRGVVQ